MTDGNEEIRPWIEGRSQNAEKSDRLKWFRGHFDVAADEIIDFLEGSGLTLDTKRVLDIGCGDGAIDLGLCHRRRPARLIGLDLVPVDTDYLQNCAQEVGIGELPKNLEFGICTPSQIPLPTCSMDAIISWSVFEHVANPVAVLAELRRIVRPGGFMFLQIWPLFYSQHGSHLWRWYPDGWVHQLSNHAHLEAHVRDSELEPPDVTEAMLADFNSLNRLTISELQRALAVTGFRISRVELLSDLINVPRDLSHLLVTDLAISGVKLIAVPV